MARKDYLGRQKMSVSLFEIVKLGLFEIGDPKNGMEAPLMHTSQNLTYFYIEVATKTCVHSRPPPFHFVDHQSQINPTVVIIY